MKNKRTAQVILILAVILAAVLIVYGATSLPKKSEKQTPTNQNQTDVGGGIPESTTGNDFSTQAIEKAATGQYYSLKNITFGLHSGYERVVFTVQSLSGIQSPGGYKVEYGSSTLTVLLYDTRLVDQNFQQVYEGPQEITGLGGIVQKIELWYPKDDSMIGAKIFVDSVRPFRVFELQDPLRIVVDIEK